MKLKPIRQDQPDAPTGQAMPQARWIARFQPWTALHSQAHPASAAHQQPIPFRVVAFPELDPPPQHLPARFPRAAPVSPAYSRAGALQRPRLRFPRAYRYRSICLLIV
jgi:hypothetical protein